MVTPPKKPTTHTHTHTRTKTSAQSKTEMFAEIREKEVGKIALNMTDLGGPKSVGGTL